MLFRSHQRMLDGCPVVSNDYPSENAQIVAGGHLPLSCHCQSFAYWTSVRLKLNNHVRCRAAHPGPICVLCSSFPLWRPSENAEMDAGGVLCSSAAPLADVCLLDLFSVDADFWVFWPVRPRSTTRQSPAQKAKVFRIAHASSRCAWRRRPPPRARINTSPRLGLGLGV